MGATGIPRGAAIAIDDLLDNCAGIKPGDEVVLAAHIDGLYGGDNFVDPQAIAWIQAAIQSRGANPSILWIDEPAKPHAWRVPPVFLAALKASNVFINHSFDLTTEEFKILQDTAAEQKVTLCRNLATTPGFLRARGRKRRTNLCPRSAIRRAFLLGQEGCHSKLQTTGIRT